jgi:hypothetical protein
MGVREANGQWRRHTGKVVVSTLLPVVASTTSRTGPAELWPCLYLPK